LHETDDDVDLMMKKQIEDKELLNSNEIEEVKKHSK